MPQSSTQRSKLPFHCHMLWISLLGATIILAIIFELAQNQYISGDVAIWSAVWVFIAAAAYEIFLFSLITRHMMKKLGTHSGRLKDSENR